MIWMLVWAKAAGIKKGACCLWYYMFEAGAGQLWNFKTKCKARHEVCWRSPRGRTRRCPSPGALPSAVAATWGYSGCVGDAGEPGANNPPGPPPGSTWGASAAAGAVPAVPAERTELQRLLVPARCAAQRRASALCEVCEDPTNKFIAMLRDSILMRLDS
jgi:hypothetical protein